MTKVRRLSEPDRIPLSQLGEGLGARVRSIATGSIAPLDSPDPLALTR
jgi:hypothetical protein